MQEGRKERKTSKLETTK